MSTKQTDKRILVIDDSVSIRNYIKLILEAENYIITLAENGAEGVKAYREGIFDLVITDVYMPIISGLELVVKLKEEFPDAKIIVLSDGGKEHFDDNLNVCEALGASSFLSKSKINEELISLVKSTLEE